MPIPENWKNVRIAHEAMQVGHLANVHRLVSRLVRKQQDGTLGQPDPNAGPEDTDVGVNVGNSIVNNYQLPGGKKPSMMRKIAWTAIALLAGGGIGSTLVPLAIEWLTSPTPPPAASFDDENTKYRIGVSGE
jgi:hypothetical protein